MSEIIPTVFTIDGVSNSTLSFYVLDGWGRQMLPGTRDRTAEIPGKDGDYWFASDLTQRAFNIPGYIVATSESDLNSKIRAQARKFVDANGKPRNISLIFTDEPLLTYTVRFNSGVDFSRWISNTRGRFEIPLVADDPYAYEAEQTDEATITTSGGTMVVTGSGTVSTPAILTITNNGVDPIAGFVITIEYEV